jgi:hypothetical protein
LDYGEGIGVRIGDIREGSGPACAFSELLDEFRQTSQVFFPDFCRPLFVFFPGDFLMSRIELVEKLPGGLLQSGTQSC